MLQSVHGVDVVYVSMADLARSSIDSNGDLVLDGKDAESGGGTGEGTTSNMDLGPSRQRCAHTACPLIQRSRVPRISGRREADLGRLQPLRLLASARSVRSLSLRAGPQDKKSPSAASAASLSVAGSTAHTQAPAPAALPAADTPAAAARQRQQSCPPASP